MKNSIKTEDGMMAVEVDIDADDWVTNLDIVIVLELGFQEMLKGFRRRYGPAFACDDDEGHRNAWLDFVCRKGLGRSQIVHFIENAAERHRLTTH